MSSLVLFSGEGQVSLGLRLQTLPVLRNHVCQTSCSAPSLPQEDTRDKGTLKKLCAHWGVAESCLPQKPGDTPFTAAQGLQVANSSGAGHLDHTLYGGVTSGLRPCLPSGVMSNPLWLLWVLKDVCTERGPVLSTRSWDSLTRGHHGSWQWSSPSAVWAWIGSLRSRHWHGCPPVPRAQPL